MKQLLFFGFAIVLFLSGCGDPTPSLEEEQSRHQIEYIDEITIFAARDSALIITESFHSYEAPYPQIILSEDPSVYPDSLDVRIEVFGLSYDPTARAAVEGFWKGDTLRVWCAPFSRVDINYWNDPVKNTPAPSFLAPVVVELKVPDGFGVRYLGHAIY